MIMPNIEDDLEIDDSVSIFEDRDNRFYPRQLESLSLAEIMNILNLSRVVSLARHFQNTASSAPSNHGHIFFQMPDFVEEMVKATSGLIRACDTLNLRMTKLDAERFLEEMDGWTPDKEQVPFSMLRKANGVLNTLQDELKLHLFLYVSPAQADLFNNLAAFGDQVALSFPTAISEIEESAKCLALHRATACVFHLMRIIEAGLKTLMYSLGQPTFKTKFNPNWNDFFTQIDQMIKSKRDSGGFADQSEEAFYVDSVTLIKSVKVSWRNPTMHIEKTYTVDEAEDIFNCVKSLMRHLSVRLSE